MMELLQYLSDYCKCTYLSDLSSKVHKGVYPFMLRATLEYIDAGQWSCAEWQEAIYYITGQTAKASSATACKNILLLMLDEQAAHSLFARKK